METSYQMIDRILAHIDIQNSKILEPSAGNGRLVNKLLGIGAHVTALELNHTNFSHMVHDLSANTAFECEHVDFLNWKSDKEFDYVCAVPPYKDNVDCEHIMKMYEHTRFGGKVISYTLPFWVTGNYTNQRLFRTWLSNKNFKIEFVEDNSYALCPKMLLIIQK